MVILVASGALQLQQRVARVQHRNVGISRMLFTGFEVISLSSHSFSMACFAVGERVFDKSFAET